MDTLYKIFQQLKLMFLGLMTCVIIFSAVTGCARNGLEPRAAFYFFSYEGENYRIRSVSSYDSAQSFNELISHDFVARDFDIDGVLDKVTLGDINLMDAQKIYEFAIDELAKQARLRRIDQRTKAYTYLNSEFKYEVKSFAADSAKFVNVFKLVELDQLALLTILVGLDNDANGTIDEIIKGTMPLDEMQKRYAKIVDRGLHDRKLVARDNGIVVK